MVLLLNEKNFIFYALWVNGFLKCEFCRVEEGETVDDGYPGVFGELDETVSDGLGEFKLNCIAGC